MLNIENGREHFFQWDLNQRLIVTDQAVNEVHFSNKTDDQSLVCEVYTEGGARLVDVPNILLQDEWTIKAYAYCDDSYTKQMKAFKVQAREKPADYVYTETEVKRWEDIEKEIKRLDAVKIGNSNYENDKKIINESIDNVNYISDAANYNAKHNAYLINLIKEKINIDAPTEQTIESNNTITIPVGAKPYARIDKLFGMCSSCDTNGGNGYRMGIKNYPKRIINNNGKVLFEIPSNNIDNLGIGYNMDYSNYVFFENGRAYLYQNCKLTDYYYSLENGEYELASFYDVNKIISLAEPIVTDISDVVLSDGYIDIIGATSLTIEMQYTEEDIKDMMDGTNYYYDAPKAIIAFEV